MTAFLSIIDHSGNRSSVTLKEGRRYGVGRSNTNEIVLLDLGLSRRHAEIFFEQGHWWIADLGSANGTILNDTRLQAPASLAPGMVVRLGGCRLYLEGEPEPAAAVTFCETPLLPGTTVTLAVDEMLSLHSAVAGRALRGENPDVVLMRRRFEVVQKATLELLAHQPPSILLPKILDLALEAVNADRAALVSRGPDGSLLIRAYRGKDPEGFTVSRTIAGKVMDEKVAILASDVSADQAFAQAQSVNIQGVRGVMAVPLWNKEDVMGLIYADSLAVVTQFTPEDLNVLTMLGNIAAIHLENARLFEEQIEKKRFEREAHAAAEIQMRLIPQTMPSISGYQFEGRMTPCYEVGGDYFDAQSFGVGRQGLIIADVAGKGMGAAILMACLQSTYHACSESEPKLERLVEQLNRAVSRRTPANRFITGFVAELDLATHRLRFVNAGHAPPPLIIRAGGAIELLMPGGPPLGVFPEFDYELGEVSLGPGDSLFACSDGLTDMTDPQGEMFGDDRLRTILSGLAGCSPEEVQRLLSDAVGRHAAGQPPPDDLTMLILRRDPLSLQES